MQPFLLNLDGDPKNQPDKSSRLNVNVNLSAEYGSISTEDGNNPLHLYPTTETYSATVIGKIPLRDGNIVLFSCVPESSTINGVSQRFINGEIGVLSPNGSYRVVIRDNGPDQAAGELTSFGWDLNTQVQGIYKINSNNTTSIYFVDSKNPTRTLNIDNTNIETDNYFRITSIVEFNKLNSLASFSQIQIDLESVDNNGNLPTGVYYVSLNYADENFNETNPLLPFGPVSIVNEISFLPINEYDGAVANTSSPKSFTISLTDVDTTFSYFKIYLIAKINEVFTVYDYDYQAITSSSMNYTINTLVNKPSSSLDVLINKINWIPKTITQLDNKNYIANLKQKERPNLQPWINGIVVDVATDYATAINANDLDVTFHNEKAVYSNRVFQHDEVYALYATVMFSDGEESEAYHIPGRNAVNVVFPTLTILENAKIDSITSPYYNVDIYNGGAPSDTSPGGEIYNIDNDARIFHAFDTSFNANAINVNGSAYSSKLGFWENENETYPDTADWDIKTYAGNIVTVNSYQQLRGNKVRHHKMPDPKYLQTGGLESANKYLPLALKFSNIQFPTELQGTIKAIKFYYAKRTNNNRLVFGQSLLIHDTEMLGSGSPTGPWASFNDGIGQNSEDYSFGMATTMQMNSIRVATGGSDPYRQFNLSKSRFRISPFDSMIGNIGPFSTSYIKVFAMSEGDYTAIDSTVIERVPPATGLDYIASGYYTPTSVLDRNNSDNYIRRLKGSPALAETVPAYPNGDVGFANNKGQFNYDLNTVHYRNDKHIILETYNDINISYSGLLSFDLQNSSQLNRNLALTNLYSFKKDLYVSFDSQELISTVGVYQLNDDVFNTNDEIIDNVYGGDIFVSFYGYRGVTDLVPAYTFDNGASNITGCEWRILHIYLCETNANINYRHQGTGEYDIYYPKSDALSVLTVPLLPNGFGNYYGYNSDYTSVNDLHQPQIHSKNNIISLDNFPTRIARSATDNPEGIQDNYRIYLANEYTDIEKSKGEIVNITNYNNRLIIQHENSIKATATRDRIKTDLGEAFMGAGDLFDYPPKDLTLTDSGYAGLKHQFASVLTQYGIFFPDTNTGKLFNLGEGLTSISDDGLKLWFLKYSKLEFEIYYKELTFSLTPIWTNTTFLLGKVVKYNNCLWENIIPITVADGNPPSTSNVKWKLLYSYDNFTFNGIDSIFYGYSAGFDNFYKRYLITKKDIVTTATFNSNYKGQFDRVLAVGWVSNSSLFTYNNQLYILRPIAGIDIINIEGFYAQAIYFNNSTYFTANRFSLAYYPEFKGFGSWYENHPDSYLSNNSQLFTTRNNILFENNQSNLPLIPNNSGPVNSTIEPIFNQQEPVRLLSSQWKTKALDVNSNEEVLTTFDTVQAYDSYQLSKENTIINTSNSRNLEGYWSCNDFRDDTANNSLKVVDNDLWYRPFTNNLNLTKHWSKLKKLVDFWFGVRLKYITTTESAEMIDGPSAFVLLPNYNTYIDATLDTIPAVQVGDILKVTTVTYTTYIKVISVVSGIIFKVKLYEPVLFNGIIEFTSIKKINKKPKLYLLDVAKLVIKNIR
jgi:hypothetical protein